MKKNGFIATSVMFSFFLVFILLSAIVLASYSHYRNISEDYNSTILDDLNENVIKEKYKYLVNSIKDGDLKSIKSGSFNLLWMNSDTFNIVPFNNTNANDTYIKFAYNSTQSTTDGSAKIVKSLDYQKIENDNEMHKVYVVFKMYRNSSVNCSYGAVSLRIGSTDHFMSDTQILCGGTSDWTTVSEILNVEVNTDNQNLIFDVKGLSDATKNIGIKNIMVVDVSDFYAKKDLSDTEVKEYLDKYLVYFDGETVINNRL